MLGDLANAMRAFGDLINAEYGRHLDDVDELLTRTLNLVHETRAALTELILLDVDPRQQADLWMLQSSVLAAVEQILQQLDLERGERSSEAWLDRPRFLTPPIGGRARAAIRHHDGLRAQSGSEMPGSASGLRFDPHPPAILTSAAEFSAADESFGSGSSVRGR
ncbi:MAG TPA: hypothetical protein VKB85_01850 [Propionibacteriaceae bacterium]|nr:hypothetical protein [Propionibacteriaceae bacterium]